MSPPSMTPELRMALRNAARAYARVDEQRRASLLEVKRAMHAGDPDAYAVARAAFRERGQALKECGRILARTMVRAGLTEDNPLEVDGNLYTLLHAEKQRVYLIRAGWVVHVDDTDGPATAKEESP